MIDFVIGLVSNFFYINIFWVKVFGGIIGIGDVLIYKVYSGK